MKNKKFYLYGLIVLFVLIIVALLFVTFSIKEIKTTYAVCEREEDIQNLEAKIKDFKGKNLVFFNQKELNTILEEFPYFELESVEKSFPSTLNIKLKERQQLYNIKYNEKYAILSKEGIVLDLLETKKDGLIEINLDYSNYFEGISSEEKKFYSEKIEVVECNIGEKIKTNFEEYFYNSLNIVSSIDSNDIFNGLQVFINEALETYDVVLSTKTKINIRLNEIENLGKEKLDFAVEEYNQQTSDFKKSNEMYNMTIRANKENKIFVQYEEVEV